MELNDHEIFGMQVIPQKFANGNTLEETAKIQIFVELRNKSRKYSLKPLKQYMSRAK